MNNSVSRADERETGCWNDRPKAGSITQAHFSVQLRSAEHFLYWPQSGPKLETHRTLEPCYYFSMVQTLVHMLFSLRIVCVAFKSVNRQYSGLRMKLPCLTALALCLGCTASANAQVMRMLQFSTHSQLSHGNSVQDQGPTTVVPPDVQQILGTTHTTNVPDIVCLTELQSLESQLRTLLGASWGAFLRDEELKCGDDCKKRVAWRIQALDKMRPARSQGNHPRSATVQALADK